MKQQLVRTSGSRMPDDEGIGDVRARRWRTLLRTAAVVNVLLWLLTATFVGDNDAYQSQQLWLSGLFLLGCAFRSFFPSVYVKRFAFDNHWTSSTFVGRCVATVAEVAFAFQLYLLLTHWSERFAVPFTGSVAWMVVLLLSVAQISCWYGVATRRYLGELVEESLWTLGIAVFFVAVLTLAIQLNSIPFAVLMGLIASGGFLVFMLAHNLPMYVRRIRNQEIQQPMLFLDGVMDMIHRRRVSYRWKHWSGEAAWLTPYFTVAVWLSIVMALVSTG